MVASIGVLIVLILVVLFAKKESTEDTAELISKLVLAVFFIGLVLAVRERFLGITLW